jgi:hypothetical protein
MTCSYQNCTREITNVLPHLLAIPGVNWYCQAHGESGRVRAENIEPTHGHCYDKACECEDYWQPVAHFSIRESSNKLERFCRKCKARRLGENHTRRAVGV